jgi:PAS domain S-box-containing protein
MTRHPDRFTRRRSIYNRFGIVEQLQVVASTAVVVAMITVISINVFSGQELTYLDFMVVITVGLFGFVSVYFSVKYGRRLEQQRRELIAINTISEAISNSVRTDVILMNALRTVTNLLDADYGWIYLQNGSELKAECSEGTKLDIVRVFDTSESAAVDWTKPIVQWERINRDSVRIPPQLKELGVQVWISQPLETSDGFSGALVLASKDIRKFDEKQMNLLSIFVSQVNVALDNARLFEQLNESKQLYADLYEHSPDMYHIIDREGKIVSCNQTEVDVLGYEKSELIGAHIGILYPSELHDQLESHLTQMFAKGKKLIGAETQIRKKNGSVLEVSVNSSQIFENGEPIKVRVVMRDITETKRMQEKLLQVQRIDSLGNLAGGIAHDFNNILVAVLSAASIMKRKMKENDPWYEYVDMIEASSRRGGALTRQLLTFARQSIVNFHPIDINDVIRETMRLMERSLDKSIVLRSDLSADFAVVEGDERQFQQVLMNLILNARDAMPDGGEISISTAVDSLENDTSPSPLAASGKFIILRVADTGVGIDKEITGKIFEPFFTTKEAGKGTGLGLSVVYGIINKHKGVITVDSEPGNGAVFTIYIPQLDVNARRHSKDRSKREAVAGGTERILVIEDETPVGKMIRDMLRELGYTITVCNSGEMGLRELQTNAVQYNLLILDLNMPTLSGRDVLQRLRGFNSSIPVIISTGYGDQVLDEQNIRTLIQGYIQKPYDEFEIGRLVRQVLDEQARPAEQ